LDTWGDTLSCGLSGGDGSGIGGEAVGTVGAFGGAVSHTVGGIFTPEEETGGVTATFGGWRNTFISLNVNKEVWGESWIVIDRVTQVAVGNTGIRLAVDHNLFLAVDLVVISPTVLARSDRTLMLQVKEQREVFAELGTDKGILDNQRLVGVSCGFTSIGDTLSWHSRGCDLSRDWIGDSGAGRAQLLVLVEVAVGRG